MKIANQCVVAIHYTLTDEQGQELDSSRDQEPLTYLHGVQGLIPGLEKELEGREAGDQFEATVQPEDAYGQMNPELVQDVHRAYIQRFVDLGFDRVYLHNVGRDQAAFISTFGEKVLPNLKL